MKKYTTLLLATGFCLGAAHVNAQTKKAPAKSGTAKKTTTVSKTPVKPAPAPAGGFTKGANNLDYKVLVKGTGTVTPKVGDFVEVHVAQYIGDSLMMNTYVGNQGKPVPFMVQTPSVKGDVVEGIMNMHVGDSTLFRIPVDSLILRGGQQRPDWIKPKSNVTWAVKLVGIKNKQQMQEEQNAHAKEQAVIDDKLIQEFLAVNNIKDAKRTESGLYYVIQKQGEGPNAVAGQKATVNYTGRNLKGETFDSNVDPAFNHVSPFEFNLGQHQVIQGWDEGVALMNKGTKATFYIPSSMAYGPQARSEQIPANAVLIFDVELVDFK